MRAHTMSILELCTAHSRAVDPSPEGAFTSEREAMSLRTVTRSPDLAAFTTGLSPAARTIETSRMARDRIATSSRTNRAIRTTLLHDFAPAEPPGFQSLATVL